MSFNERDAIRFRLEQMAEESKDMRNRMRELDSEYAAYIKRLQELDGPAATQNLPSDGENTVNSPENSHELKQYDFDKIRERLRSMSTASKSSESEKRIIDSSKLRGQSHDLKKAAQLVEEILKEKGEPLKISRLKEALADKGYRWNYFSSTLPQIMRYSSCIIKPYRGHLQYSKDHLDSRRDINKEKSQVPENAEPTVN